ncbi:MAG: serine hydrolase [Phycisphaerales bacterium]
MLHPRFATLLLVAALSAPLAPTPMANRAAAAAPPPDARTAAVEAAIQPALVIAGVESKTPALAQRMDELGVPAVSVVVIEDGRIAWTHAWGVADLESGRRATPNTLFQAASISKPVAAMVALAHVDAGTLSLDDDVQTALRAWTLPAAPSADWPAPTLRQLLSHSAGLNVHGFPGFGPSADVPSAAGILRGEGNTEAVRLMAKPGSQFSYSGGGYTVMQQMIEDATGLDFADAASTTVLEPLGMSASRFAQPLPADVRASAATGYWDVDRPVDGGAHTYPQLAAAGLWTTPSDLARWLVSVVNARRGGEHPVLASATLNAMLQPGLDGWGLGLETSDDGTRISHGGANEGFRCWMTLSLATGNGLVVMTNSDGGGRLAREVALTVDRVHGWDMLSPTVRTVATVPMETLDALAGEYRAEGWGSATITRRGRELYAVPTWDEPTRLLPESATQFFLPDSGMTVRFIRENDVPDGRVLAAVFGSWRFDRVPDRVEP